MNELDLEQSQDQLQGMCSHGNFPPCEKCVSQVERELVEQEAEPSTSFVRLKEDLQQALKLGEVVSDSQLREIVARGEGREPAVYYHATRTKEWQNIDPNYFDREQIVLAGGHFSYKADNLSYGSWDPGQLIEFRVIDTAGELKDTSQTGEGTQVGHEAIAVRPVVLKKLDDRVYQRAQIEQQSGLPVGFSAAPEGVEEKPIRQITYYVDHGATQQGTVADFLHDPAFVAKYVNDIALESIESPLHFMDEARVEELASVAELNAADYPEPGVADQIGKVKTGFSDWFRLALAKEEQVVQVLAKDKVSWQDKTDQILRAVAGHEKFIDYYVNEYMPEYVSDFGLYKFDADTVAKVKAEALQAVEQYQGGE